MEVKARFKNEQDVKDFLKTTSNFLKFDVYNLLRIQDYDVQDYELKAFNEWSELGIGIKTGSKAYRLAAPYFTKDSKIIERDMSFFGIEHLNEDSFSYKPAMKSLTKARNYLSFYPVQGQVASLVTSTQIHDIGFSFEDTPSNNIDGLIMKYIPDEHDKYLINSSMSKTKKLRLLLMICIANQLKVDYNLDIEDVGVDLNGYVDLGNQVNSIIGLACLFIIDSALRLNQEINLSFDMLLNLIQRRSEDQVIDLLEIIVKTSQRVVDLIRDGWVEVLYDVEFSDEEEGRV